MPCSAATSMPSLKGKKASDAMAAPVNERSWSAAFMAAIRALTTRLIWPAPTPTVRPPRAKTMALDLTYLQTIQANIRSSSSLLDGARRDTILTSMSSGVPGSRSCTSSPPAVLLRSQPPERSAGADAASSARTFFFAARASRAAGRMRGATTTSTICRSMMDRAGSASSGRLKAMIPPKADVGSVAKARSYAACGVAAMAAPQGLACLTITQAHSWNAPTHWMAASASARLLKLSALPCTWLAAATPVSSVPGSR